MFGNRPPPPLTLCTGGRGGAESTVKMSEPEQPPFTVLPGADWGIVIYYVLKCEVGVPDSFIH